MVGYCPSSFLRFGLGQYKCKNERGQYTVIMIEQAWSIKDLSNGQKDNIFLWGRCGKSEAGKILTLS